MQGVTLERDDLERFVTDASARASGPLWRISLAQAAAAELGITLADAVAHPEVQRAHQLVKAPPYAGERAWSAPPAVAAPVPQAAAAPPAPPAAPIPLATAPSAAPVPAEHADPAPGPASPPAGSSDGLSPPPASLAPHADAIRIAAIHVGGLEAVRAGERDLELRFSPAGLDVLRRSTGAPIGRLRWDQIRTVELPKRRRGLRAFRGAPELHVETDNGRASFELPGVNEQDLDEHLAPLLARNNASG